MVPVKEKNEVHFVSKDELCLRETAVKKEKEVLELYRNGYT